MDCDALSAAIKHLEPALRVQGRAIDWNKFNAMYFDGSFGILTENPSEEVVAKVLERYDADPLEL